MSLPVTAAGSRPVTPSKVIPDPPKCAEKINFTSLPNIFKKKEFKGQGIIMWDLTRYGNVRNHFNYTGVLIDFMKQAYEV